MQFPRAYVTCHLQTAKTISQQARCLRILLLPDPEAKAATLVSNRVNLLKVKAKINTTAVTVTPQALKVPITKCRISNRICIQVVMVYLLEITSISRT